MAASSAFQVTRQTLVAGVLTPILPQMAVAKDVTIQNGTGADLEVHSSDGGSNYVVIVEGFEREFWGNYQLYQRNQIAFWLRSAGGGPVVMIWIP